MLMKIVAEYVGSTIAKLLKNPLPAATSQTDLGEQSLSAVFRLVRNRSSKVPAKPTLQQLMKYSITRGYI